MCIIEDGRNPIFFKEENTTTLCGSQKKETTQFSSCHHRQLHITLFHVEYREEKRPLPDGWTDVALYYKLLSR
jgi:hypothetical protein